VRLLFDQNPSPRLLTILADLHGGSTHVRNEGLQTANDDTVWEYAAHHGFAIQNALDCLEAVNAIGGP
jgi:predicted nuclease of predicted toxin-antitoxin system